MAAMEYIDGFFDYKGSWGQSSICGLKIFKAAGSIIVILTELPDNPGMSVTNAVEFVASGVLRDYELDPEKVLWIEHYPEDRTPGSVREETFDLVNFGGVQGFTCHSPNWLHLGKAGFEEVLRTGRPPAVTQRDHADPDNIIH